MEIQTQDIEFPRTYEEMCKHRDKIRQFYQGKGIVLCKNTDPFWDYLEYQADSAWYDAFQCLRCGEKWGWYYDVDTMPEEHICSEDDRV